MKLIIFVLMALIGGQAAASGDYASADYNSLLQLIDEFNQGLEAGNGINAVVAGSSDNQLFKLSDDFDKALEYEHTNILYGTGPDDLVLQYCSKTTTDLENRNYQTDLTADFSGATSVGVYTDNTFLTHSSEGTEGTQIKAWVSFDLPLGTDAKLDINGQRDLSADTQNDLSALNMQMRGTFTTSEAEHDFEEHDFERDLSDWNVDTDYFDRVSNGFNWGIGSEYSDILVTPGLEYQGSMGMVISSDYE